MPAEPQRPPGPSDGEDIFSLNDPAAAERAGPLSGHGIRAFPHKTVTLGDFRILRKAGTGRTGAVYLAYQISHGRHVALKILGKNVARRPGFVERFARESAILDRLDHPGIVRGYGVGAEHGFYYYAMEFVDGLDLEKLLRRQGGKLLIGDALHIVMRCAEALGHAHERQIIHRDVKPENIMVNSKGVVKLTDLGLAKPTNEDLSLTETNQGMGTPRYMAPEQARDAKRVGPRCDIYALGGVLYHLLTGDPPFADGTIVEQVQAKEKGAFVPASKRNRSVPRQCDRILVRMLAPDPDSRHPSCAALARDLDRLGLTNLCLSFDYRQRDEEEAAAPSPTAGPSLEVFLVYDDLSYVPLVQRALQTSEVPSNLTVAEEGKEAMDLLNMAGRVQESPKPDLIIVGLSQPTPGSMRVLGAVATNRLLRKASMCAVSVVPEAADLLRGWGLELSLWITGFDDLGPLEEAIRAAYRQRQSTTEPTAS